jgi:hypothetical protein
MPVLVYEDMRCVFSSVLWVFVMWFMTALLVAYNYVLYMIYGLLLKLSGP